MKAFLVLAAIYVGAFLIAIQGASQTQAEGVANKPGIQHNDPAKAADILRPPSILGTYHLKSRNAGRHHFRQQLGSTGF